MVLLSARKQNLLKMNRFCNDENISYYINIVSSLNAYAYMCILKSSLQTFKFIEVVCID